MCRSLEAGGAGTAPTPTDLFAASLATCVAFYADRYLHRHGMPQAGPRVHDCGVMGEHFVITAGEFCEHAAGRQIIYT